MDEPGKAGTRHLDLGFWTAGWAMGSVRHFSGSFVAAGTSAACSKPASVQSQFVQCPGLYLPR